MGDNSLSVGTGTGKFIAKSSLVENLKSGGLRAGDTVMVHASLRAIGPMLGGPDDIIEAIMEATAPSGTMMMYAGCNSPFDDIGRGTFSEEEEAFIRANCPPFDATTARASRSFGALAELFRSYPGVIASRNPGARMVALGKNSHALLDDHPLQQGYGQGSPLEKLCMLDGKVLLLGSDLDQVTLLHYAEAIAPITEKRTVHITVPLLADGGTEWIEIEEYDTSDGICEWPENFFATIVQAFIEHKGLQLFKVGNATSYLLGAKALVDFGVAFMLQAQPARAQ